VLKERKHKIEKITKKVAIVKQVKPQIVGRRSERILEKN